MENLEVTFKDSLPLAESSRKLTARRLKQLKQGRLQPQATLDLHGCRRDEVATKLEYFFTNARHHGWQNLLIITGKGLHSATGESVLRRETERYLHGQGAAEVVEWGQAPQRHGGEGALAVFLRKSEGETVKKGPQR
jgi:DNA-nicking Smr family endonuclease